MQTNPLCKPTYKLEGDGRLAFNCISSLTAAVNLAHYPNVRAVVREIAGSNKAVQQQLEAYATTCVKPALDYHTQHLAAETMSIPLSGFKAAHLFSPHKLQEINPGCNKVDGLSAFPFLHPPALTAMKNELPQYIAAAEDVSSDYGPLDF